MISSLFARLGNDNSFTWLLLKVRELARISVSWTQSKPSSVFVAYKVPIVRGIFNVKSSEKRRVQRKVYNANFTQENDKEEVQHCEEDPDNVADENLFGSMV